MNLRAVAIVDTPINVDRTPPVSGTVRDGADLTKDINYQSDTTSICMNWEGFSDPHSKIVLYQWGVGLIPGNFSVVPLQNLTNEEVKSRKVCEAVTLFNDVTYYSTLIVTNGADLVTSVSSNGGKQLVLLNCIEIIYIIYTASSGLWFDSNLYMYYTCLILYILLRALLIDLI